MKVVDTIEYSVCEDCMLYVAHSGEETEDGQTEQIGQAMQRELNGREGQFICGVASTEDDPEGTGFDEFSRQDCELCRSSLGGSRHGITMLLT